MPIKYEIGDATNPQGSGKKLIIHISNNCGAWGAGFVKAISRKWKEPEECYRNWYRQGKWNDVEFGLGEIQVVQVEKDISVVNMIAQHKVGWNNGIPPIRYQALDECLNKVAQICTPDVSIIAPRIGCGLGGGSWDKIEPLIQKNLGNFDVTIFDFN